MHSEELYRQMLGLTAPWDGDCQAASLLVCDLEASTVEYIGEGRSEESLAGYFEALTEEQREAIEAISLDMWPAYIGACRRHVPEADSKMVFDRFHIIRHVLDAVDKVRKQEHKTLLGAGEERLSRSKYLSLTNPQNMTDKARAHFADLKAAELKTARAWAISIPPGLQRILQYLEAISIGSPSYSIQRNRLRLCQRRQVGFDMDRSIRVY